MWEIFSVPCGSALYKFHCIKTLRFGDWILSPSSGGTYSDRPNLVYAFTWMEWMEFIQMCLMLFVELRINAVV
jgi:hypothetical protein